MANLSSDKKLPVSLTQNAIQAIKETMVRKNIGTEYRLRVGIKGALGCGSGGISFLLGFDKPKPEDDAFEHEGIPIVIEKKHTMYIIGMQIDYVTENDASGFTFRNPDAG